MQPPARRHVTPGLGRTDRHTHRWKANETCGGNQAPWDSTKSGNHNYPQRPKNGEIVARGNSDTTVIGRRLGRVPSEASRPPEPALQSMTRGTKTAGRCLIAWRQR